jgi:hypothetical protein
MKSDERSRLDRLVEAARAHVMTPAERFEQRVSFIYGQMADGHGALSKDDIRQKLRERGYGG